MKLKPFNLEEAKAGQPFCYHSSPNPKPSRFIGVRSDGFIVYEQLVAQLIVGYREPSIQTSHPDYLRMICDPPKKIKVWIAKGNHPKDTTFVTSNEFWVDSTRANHHSNFRILAGPFELEYDEDPSSD